MYSSEIEGRDRDTERKRDIETKRHRERTDNKNPKQSRVAQLVHNNYQMQLSRKVVFFLNC